MVTVPEPYVPAPDHTVARIVAQGDLAGAFTRGFAAVSQVNAQRQAHELQARQLVQRAAVDEQNFMLAKQKQDHELRIETSLHPYRQAALKAQAASYGTGLASRAKVASMAAQYEADFNARVEKYNLLDPNPKNPIEWAANVRKLDDEFRYANVPTIKNSLKQFHMQAESFAVPLKVGGKTVPMPAIQIVENLQDPDKAEEMKGILAQNKLATAKTVKAPIAPEKVPWHRKDFVQEWITGKQPTRYDSTKTAEPAPQISRWVEQSKGVDLSRSKPRTPVAGLRGDVNEDAPLPQSESLVRPTEIDGIRAMAQKAIAAGRDPEAVRSIFKEQTGQDL